MFCHKRKIPAFSDRPLLDYLNMTPSPHQITKSPASPPCSPPFPHPTPPPLPALPTHAHLPPPLCALTSLPMRVIGTSKRWRGQKGTQPHPETLIGESLEAQRSKGERLNCISMHTYTFLQPRASASFFSIPFQDSSSPLE